jgi:hypothetical protein
VLNAVLLLPLLCYMFGISRDKRLMGEFRASTRMQTIYVIIISMVAFCVLCMLWFTIK